MFDLDTYSVQVGYKCIMLSTIKERIYDSITEFFYKVQEEKLLSIVEFNRVYNKKYGPRLYLTHILPRTSRNVKDLSPIILSFTGGKEC
jgi:hypothetical protein